MMMGHSVWVGLAETASRLEDPPEARRPPVQHQAQPGGLGVSRQAGGAGGVRCFRGGKVPASAGLHCRRAGGGPIRRRCQIGVRWPQGAPSWPCGHM